MKKFRTFKQHQELGEQLYLTRETLLEVSCGLYNTNRRKLANLASKAYSAIDTLRCELDELVFREYPEHETQELCRVYYCANRLKESAKLTTQTHQERGQTKTTPILRGSISGQQINVYCPFCDTLHPHSWGTEANPHRERDAHCFNPESPLLETGYRVAPWNNHDKLSHASAPHCCGDCQCSTTSNKP